MSIFTWPRALPCPDLQGLSLRSDDGTLRSEMSSGALRERRIYVHAPTVYNASITLSRTQTLILQSFAQKVMGSEFEIDLALPFDLYDWAQTYTARFTGFGEPRPINGSDWRTTFSLRLKRVPRVCFRLVASDLSRCARRLMSARMMAPQPARQFWPAARQSRPM